jgi:ribonucleoside-triphosphate reductase
MGAGGVSTGSINVITVNLNRLIQDIANGKRKNIEEEIEKVIKYQVAYRKNIELDLNAGMLPVYDAGYISLDKQFLTIGVNGIVEAAEFLKIVPGNNSKYINWCKDILKEIDSTVKRANLKYGYKFNVEFVPAENLGVKNAEWDKKDGYFVTRDCYNSYFYIVEDENTTDVDKFFMHGKDVTQYLSGGSALHLNLSAYPTKESAIKLFELAGKTGCNYWCTNILISYCETCHNIDLNTVHQCKVCESRDISHATRVIGYLKKIKNFSAARQKEATVRVYH